MEASICDSQNFCLKLSQDSTVSNSFAINEDTDIVVISDSSSKSVGSDYKYRSKPILNKYPLNTDDIYIVESSDSESVDIHEGKILQTWKLNNEHNLIKHQKKRQDSKKNNISYTSDESSSVNTENVENCNTNSSKTDSSYITATAGSSTKTVSKTNVQSCRNKAHGTNCLPSNTSINGSSSSKSSRSSAKSVSKSSVSNKSDRYEQFISKRDAKNIIKNIKSTKLIYESPKVQKKNSSVNPDDIHDNGIHPAISPEHRLTTLNKVIDETLENSESDCILGSQVNLAVSYKTHVSKFLNAPHVEKDIMYSELSEQKKKQISQWLMTNSPESHSDSSFGIVPPSHQQDISSGNSSLERLEMNYETPNNRDRVRKNQGSERRNGQTNFGETPRTAAPKTSEKGVRSNYSEIHNIRTPKQTTINDYIQKTKNNELQLCTSVKKSNTNKNIMFSNVTTDATRDTPQKMDIQDCADILDKLYGSSWRANADVLFANSEPRKKMIFTKNRAVQTERKAIPRERLYISDSDDDSNTSFKDLNPKSRSTQKNIRKEKQRNSFINDESSSESGTDSLYHTALTHPRFSTNSEKVKPVVPPIRQRVLAICDTDSEDANEPYKKSENEVTDLKGKKLLFRNHESSDSDTSEFDPGDNIPPKPTGKKVTGQIPKTSNQPKPASESKKYKKHASFLESLSESVPIPNVHPAARKYRLDYKNNKENLCSYLYKLYNENVFDKNLPEDMSIEWNVRMRGTAGFCYNKKSLKTLGGITKSSRIVLATKILDTPDRLRDTLIHEMCHAAAWLINDVSDGHGPFWTGWANKAMKAFPELPQIRRCHDYKVKTKFTYKCVGCGYSIGRHSKSLDVERKRCGHCFGKFELLVNKTTKSGTIQVQTPKREPTAFALYVKENYNSVKKERNIKHAEVMKILGQQFSAIKIAKRQENDENDSDNIV